LSSRDGRTLVDGAPVDGSPWEVLRAELDRHPLVAVPGAGPLQGGAVGYLGYELGRYLETVPQPPADALDPPEMVMMLCDLIVVVDHRDRRAWIVSSGLPEADPAARRA